MTVKEMKANHDYSFECNMSDWYKNYENIDEWGCAFTWYGDIGVEYNFAVETYNNEKYTACAIYKMEFNNETENMETDYDTFVEYDIDFNDVDWIDKLENAMCEALIKFFDL